MSGNTAQYHPRNPESSPLWNLLKNHYDSFEQKYEEQFEKPYGFFRPVIGDVVRDYLKISSILFLIGSTSCRIPIRLRVYFKHDRQLLSKLCHCAYESLLLFSRHAMDLSVGIPAVVMAIHTFGDYPEKYHPHLHAIVTDGLFTERGTFYVMPKVDSKPLEDIFRARIFYDAQR